MSRPVSLIISLVLVALVAGAGGFGLYRWLNPTTLTPEPVQQLTVPETRPEFTLPDLSGAPRNITEWDGKALLVNFWATWCPPCRKEIPLLKQMQTKYGAAGLQVIGIAVDETALVQDYAREMQFNYPVLVGQMEAVTVANRFGIDLYGLPFSVLTDRQGRILEIHQGEITPDQVQALVAKMLPETANAAN